MRSQKIIHKSFYNKTLSILLIIALLFAMIPAFGISALALDVSAQSEYDKLWNEKLTYEMDKKVYYGQDSTYSLSYGVDFSFILFTNQIDELSYEFINYYDVDENHTMLSSYWRKLNAYGPVFDGKVVASKKLRNIINSCEISESAWSILSGKSEFRHIVRTLDISYDELKTAFSRMKNEPEYVRDVFSYMTDDEFLDIAEYFKSLETPPDYILKAACMKNDEQAESLLASPGSVYIKEKGRTYSSLSVILYSDWFSVDELCEFDLTTKSFVKFISDIDRVYDEFYDYHFNDTGYLLFKDEKGRDGLQRYDYIVSNQKKQLANPKTGEAWYFIPVAAVSLVAGIFVICPRRKRMLER